MRLTPFGGASFDDALLACHGSVYRYARGLCHDPMLAEELVQECYRRALDAGKRPRPATEESLRPWLFTILRNVWYNDVRRRRHEALPESEGEPVCADDDPETAVSRRFLQSEVRDAVDTLPEAYREVILLREIESLSYAEIAALLNCPLGTVMSRLARARTLLRQLLVPIAPIPKGAPRR